MTVTKNPQNVHKVFLTDFNDIKIDINMSEPHCVNLFLVELHDSPGIQIVDILKAL